VILVWVVPLARATWWCRGLARLFVAQQALQEMPRLVYELRPLALESEGLVDALEQRVETVELRACTGAHLRAGRDRTATEIEQDLYCSAKEALNNALEHARASRVKWTIRAAEPPCSCK
jgi:signal transduction histidine kinase